MRYVTKSYLLRKAKRTLKQVAAGEEAYCDLEQLVQKYPTLLPDVEAAKQVAAAECLHMMVQSINGAFYLHYAIGDVGLNNTAKQCMETLGRQRYLNTKVSWELQILVVNWESKYKALRPSFSKCNTTRTTDPIARSYCRVLAILAEAKSTQL